MDIHSLKFSFYFEEFIFNNCNFNFTYKEKIEYEYNKSTYLVK